MIVALGRNALTRFRIQSCKPQCSNMCEASTQPGIRWVKRDRSFQYVAYVREGVRPPAPGVRLIGRVGITDGWGHQTVSLWEGRRAR